MISNIEILVHLRSDGVHETITFRGMPSTNQEFDFKDARYIIKRIYWTYNKYDNIYECNAYIEPLYKYK